MAASWASPSPVDGVVVNSGSTTFDDVTATFDVSAELEADAATWGDDNPCEVAISTVTCALGAVDAYSNVPIAVDVTPVAVGDSVTTITVSSSQPEDDPDPFPNVQQLTVPVVAPTVDLGVASGHFEPVVLGEGEAVFATVTNAGPAIARETQLSVVVPDNFTDLDGFIPAGQEAPNATGCDVSGQVVTCGLGDLAAGSDTIVQITMLTIDFGDEPLQWSVTSAVPEVDPDPDTQHGHVVLAGGAAERRLRDRGVLRTCPCCRGRALCRHALRGELRTLDW